MTWTNRKYIFKPAGEYGWMNTHAQIPTVLVLNDRFRVYLSCRKTPSLSQTAILDLDVSDPTRILKIYPEPALALGKPGSFDEFGVMPSAVIEHDNKIYLYTTGWTRGETVPYINAIGLAISEDGGLSFTKPYTGPLLTATKDDPYSVMAPFVMKEKDVWRMWYSSVIDWYQGTDKYEPIYIIKYAYSDDGINWNQPNIICIPAENSEEAITRPTVLKDGDLYHMWFCSRGSQDFRGGSGSFKIGYANSKDGLVWNRDDKPGLPPSGANWESNMTAYPYVVETNNLGRLMFYSGNYFGKEGFGVARWKE